MTKPLISVILPVYNVEAYLESCVKSLLAQTYENLELLIVDDGSGPVCAELCDALKSADERITVWHKPNGGLSDARNFGLERARGEYVAFVDSDDSVDADYLSYLYSLCEQFGTDLAMCQIAFHYPNGKIQAPQTFEPKRMSARDAMESMLYHREVDTSACAKLYRRALFRDVRYPVGRLFEDMGTTYRLIMQCSEVAVGCEPLYHYMIRGGSIVTGAFNPRKLDLLEMTDTMAEAVTARWPELEQAALRRRVYARFSTLNQMLDCEPSPEREEILRFLREHAPAVARDPAAPRRDKLAARALSMGFGAYRTMWKTYLRLVKGETA